MTTNWGGHINNVHCNAKIIIDVKRWNLESSFQYLAETSQQEVLKVLMCMSEFSIKSLNSTQCIFNVTEVPLEQPINNWLIVAL